MAFTTLWQADELRKVLLSEIMAISKAGSFLLLPVLVCIVHDKWLFSSITSGGAPWNGSNPPTRIWARSSSPFAPVLSSWKRLKIRLATSSQRSARVVQTLCWWGCRPKISSGLFWRKNICSKLWSGPYRAQKSPQVRTHLCQLLPEELRAVNQKAVYCVSQLVSPYVILCERLQKLVDISQEHSLLTIILSKRLLSYVIDQHNSSTNRWPHSARRTLSWIGICARAIYIR